MHPYIIDVSELLEDPGATLHADSDFGLDELVVGDERFAVVAPATVDVHVANAGSGLVVSGTVAADVRAECARCLCDFDTRIEGEVEGFYVPYGSSAADAEDAEQVSATGTIDVGPVLTAALVIEAPFAPLHDPDCAGLCAECGADLNEGPCGCVERADDAHPFAGLRSLLEEDDAPA